ncbi:hypothetical protein [Streptosporangium sp. V21-05]|uniref:hypothetical protein n=1 Tax=Streptosporangium sp. V21-05 TaxID=3446115 RepID=UPI003F53C61F
MPDTSNHNDARIKRWQRLLETRAPVQVESIKIFESDVFEPQVIELNRATAVVGSHGTGKTVLLRLIEASLGYLIPSYSPPLFVDTLYGDRASSALKSIVEITVRKLNSRVTRTIDLTWPAKRRHEIWKDDFGGNSIAIYNSAISAFGELQILYDDYPRNGSFVSKERSIYQLSRVDLDGIRNILGRNYDQVTVNPVVISEGTADTHEECCPYVIATSGDHIIDSGKMSLGEIWVHYVLNWTMTTYLEPGDLIMVDEPESFLSSMGQRPMIDEIARRTLAKEAQLLVATHSPEVLGRFPLENIRMCVRNGQKIRVITPNSRAQIRDSVGIETPVKAFVLVEDEFAKTLFQSLCGELAPWLLRELEIISAGSASEVLSGIRVFARSSQFKSFAILDGDQRDSSLAKKSSDLKILFLPGSQEPEDELLNNATLELEWLSEILARSVDHLLSAISDCSNLDHQYKLKFLATRLGHHEAFLIHSLIRAWLRNPQVKQEADSIIATIEGASL